LQRVEQRWYDSLDTNVLEGALGYISRYPDQRYASHLLGLVRTQKGESASHALAAVASKPVTDEILSLLELSLEEIAQGKPGNSFETRKHCVLALSLINPEFIDMPRLLSDDRLFNNSYERYKVRKIVVSSGESAKGFLADLLKSPDRDKYDFARFCFEDMNMSLDEMSQYFDKNPIIQLNEFFFGGSFLPIKIWEQRKDLGLQLKKKFNPNRFDFLVQTLLSSFNFITLNVDHSGKQGVDVVGVSPLGLRLIVAGVTSAAPKDDLQKLNTTIREMKSSFSYPLSQFKIYPVLFTNSDDRYPSDNLFAREHGIIVLNTPEIQELLKMSVTGRTTKDLILFLETKEREIRYNNVPV